MERSGANMGAGFGCWMNCRGPGLPSSWTRLRSEGPTRHGPPHPGGRPAVRVRLPTMSGSWEMKQLARTPGLPAPQAVAILVAEAFDCGTVLAVMQPALRGGLSGRGAGG